jgi:hypothetical protein
MINSFDDAIERALNRGHKDLARRLRMEKRMATGLVKACLDLGFSISINNGEDWEIRKSTNSRKIMAAMFTTDEEYLVIHDEADKKRGWFFLVYGNDGWDLISDYSANDTCDMIWNETLSPLSDKVQAGG